MKTIYASLIGVGMFFVFCIAGYFYYRTKKKNPMGYSIPKAGGGLNMDKLEEEVFKEFRGAYHDIMDTLKEAEKNNSGVDLGEFVKQQASRFECLNTHFREAKIRNGRR